MIAAASWSVPYVKQLFPIAIVGKGCEFLILARKSFVLKVQNHWFVVSEALTVTISSISCLVMYPLPSRSYMLKAHLSFWSSCPLEVTDSAQMNSRKSIVPAVKRILKSQLLRNAIYKRVTKRIT